MSDKSPRRKPWSAHATPLQIELEAPRADPIRLNSSPRGRLSPGSPRRQKHSSAEAITPTFCQKRSLFESTPDIQPAGPSTHLTASSPEPGDASLAPERIGSEGSTQSFLREGSLIGSEIQEAPSLLKSTAIRLCHDNGRSLQNAIRARESEMVKAKLSLIFNMPVPLQALASRGLIQAIMLIAACLYGAKAAYSVSRATTRLFSDTFQLVVTDKVTDNRRSSASDVATRIQFKAFIEDRGCKRFPNHTTVTVGSDTIELKLAEPTSVDGFSIEGRDGTISESFGFHIRTACNSSSCPPVSAKWKTVSASSSLVDGLGFHHYAAGAISVPPAGLSMRTSAVTDWTWVLLNPVTEFDLSVVSLLLALVGFFGKSHLAKYVVVMHFSFQTLLCTAVSAGRMHHTSIIGVHQSEALNDAANLAKPILLIVWNLAAALLFLYRERSFVSVLTNLGLSLITITLVDYALTHPLKPVWVVFIEMGNGIMLLQIGSSFWLYRMHLRRQVGMLLRPDKEKYDDHWQNFLRGEGHFKEVCDLAVMATLLCVRVMENSNRSLSEIWTSVSRDANGKDRKVFLAAFARSSSVVPGKAVVQNAPNPSPESQQLLKGIIEEDQSPPRLVRSPSFRWAEDLIKPLDSSIDQLYAQALCLDPILKSKVIQWASLSKGGFRSNLSSFMFVTAEQARDDTCGLVKWASIKNVDRTLEKLLQVYDHDTSLILDLCRQSILFLSVTDLTRCLATIANDCEVDICRIQNGINPHSPALESAGYRMCKLNLKIRSDAARELGIENHVCEVQLLLLDVANLQSQEMHSRYLQYRNFARPHWQLPADPLPAPKEVPTISQQTANMLHAEPVTSEHEECSDRNDSRVLSYRKLLLFRTTEEGGALSRKIKDGYLMRTCDHNSVLFTSRPTAAAIARPRWRLLFGSIVLLALGRLGGAYSEYFSSRSKSHLVTGLRFTALQSRNGASGAMGTNASIESLGPMMDGCPVDLSGRIMNQSNSGRNFVVFFDSEIQMNGWYFDTATSIPELDPVKFSLEGYRGQQWIQLDASARRVNDDGSIRLLDDIYLTSTERSFQHRLDLRLPLTWILWWNVDLIPVLVFTAIAALVSTNPRLAHHANQIHVLGWLLTALYVTFVAVLLSQNGQQKESVQKILFSVPLWILVLVLGIKERHMMITYGLVGLFWVALEIFYDLFVWRDSAGILPNFPTLAVVLTGSSVIAHIMQLWSIFRSNQRIRKDAEQYERVWDQVRGADESNELSALQQKVAAIAPPNQMRIIRQYQSDIAVASWIPGSGSSVKSDRSADHDVLTSHPFSSSVISRGSNDSTAPITLVEQGSKRSDHFRQWRKQSSMNRYGPNPDRSNGQNWLEGWLRRLGLKSKVRSGDSLPTVHPSGLMDAFPHTFRTDRSASAGSLSSQDSRQNLNLGRKRVSSLDLLYAQAILMEPLLREKVQQWARSSDGHFPAYLSHSAEVTFASWAQADENPYIATRIKWGRLKGVTRAVEKLLRMYKENASLLLDICRESIVFKHVKDLVLCLQAIHDDPDVKVLRIKNRYMDLDASSTAGFRNVCLNLLIRNDETAQLGIDGHVCEVQLILQPFAEVMRAEGHRRYIRFRNKRGM